MLVIQINARNSPIKVLALSVLSNAVAYTDNKLNDSMLIAPKVNDVIPRPPRDRTSVGAVEIYGILASSHRLNPGVLTKLGFGLLASTAKIMEAEAA
jgi:hypothetical protein